jgi:hypothetical protein
MAAPRVGEQLEVQDPLEGLNKIQVRWRCMSVVLHRIGYFCLILSQNQSGVLKLVMA